MDLTCMTGRRSRSFNDQTELIRHAGSAGKIDLVNTQNWRDQYVIAVGAAYEVHPELFTVRGGTYYANNPIPDPALQPAIPGAVPAHLTAGAGTRSAKHVEIDAAFRVGVEVQDHLHRTAAALRPRTATDKPSGYTVDITLGYRF
jgi:long-chain fatty acid transport protein